MELIVGGLLIGMVGMLALLVLAVWRETRAAETGEQHSQEEDHHYPRIVGARRARAA